MDIAHTFSNLSKGASNSFSSLKINSSNSAKTIKLKLDNYFKNSGFESDLDELINLLHKHSKARADFSHFTNFDSRISAKKNFLKTQALLAVFGAATVGAAAAIQAGQFQFIGESVLISAGGMVLMIVATAAGIIIKRMVNGIEISSSIVIV